MPQTLQTCILAVGVLPPADNEFASYVHAETGGRALELMKLLRFDLVVVSPVLRDLSVPLLVRQMRVIAPWQRWALVGPGITDSAEISARCHGVLAVIDEAGDWSGIEELAASVCQRLRRPVAL